MVGSEKEKENRHLYFHYHLIRFMLQISAMEQVRLNANLRGIRYCVSVCQPIGGWIGPTGRRLYIRYSCSTPRVLATGYVCGFRFGERAETMGIASIPSNAN